MAINRKQAKKPLEAREFGELFNQLGWDWPASDSAYPVKLGEELFQLHPVANKRGFFAYHCPCLPNSATRAEPDAIIAHLYGLTETEFRQILTTFPLIDESIKTATLTEFLKTEK
jgi:hypothetical protein